MRQTRVGLVLALFFGWLVAAVDTAIPQETSPKRPSFVVLLSDDMGISDLGCYGGEIRTPHLDQLAASGLRFSQFYNTSRCCPTRASLLTGLYPHQAGVGHMMEDRGLPAYQGNLNRSCRTMAEVLRDGGYRSYAVGKWHVTRHTAPEGPKDNWPLQRGFDRFYGTIHGAGSFFDPSSLVRDNTMISPMADPQYQPQRFYYTDAITDHAVRFLEDHHRDHTDQPFLLYIAYTASHWPMHAMPEDIARYRGRYDAGYEAIRRERIDRGRKLGWISSEWKIPALLKSWEDTEHRKWEAAGMEVYAAMVDRMDQGIGRILQTLSDKGMDRSTYVLYLQDNGACAETVGRKGNAKHPDILRPSQPTLPPISPDQFATSGSTPDQTRDGFPVRMGTQVMPGEEDTYVAYGQSWAQVSNTPLREFKHWVHEGGISSPLILRGPLAHRQPGTWVDQPAHLIDIAATLYDLTGVTYPADATALEGVSLRPVLDGKPLPDRLLFWEHEGNRAVRKGDWKLVAKHPLAWELYRIPDDRTEQEDLAEKHPELVEELSARYDEFARRCGIQPWPLAQ
jgi:arylsulfatase